MARPENRSQLMAHFGAVQLNTVWSWCAVNDSDQSVYLSVWTDHVEKIDGVTTYTLQGPDWGVDELGRKSAARNDHDQELSLVFEHGYKAYGYFLEAKDRSAIPREIADIRSSFVMEMALSKSEDGWATGTPIKRIEVR